MITTQIKCSQLLVDISDAIEYCDRHECYQLDQIVEKVQNKYYCRWSFFSKIRRTYDEARELIINDPKKTINPNWFYEIALECLDIIDRKNQLIEMLGVLKNMPETPMTIDYEMMDLIYSRSYPEINSDQC